LDIVRQVRRQLGLGVRRLHAYLTQAGLISCSLSSVYRVLHLRKPRLVWTRYAKPLPEERAQMDLMYLPEGRCQLPLVDDCSRPLAATVLTQRTTTAVCSEEWERGLEGYLRFYNRRRLHSALGYTVPMAYALQRLPRAFGALEEAVLPLRAPGPPRQRAKVG
jgi:transposase InsO family protein